MRVCCIAMWVWGVGAYKYRVCVCIHNAHPMVVDVEPIHEGARLEVPDDHVRVDTDLQVAQDGPVNGVAASPEKEY